VIRKILSLIAILYLPFDTAFSQEFQAYPTTLPGFQAGGTSWGDFDKDGDLDLVINGILGSGTPVTKVYRNQNGEFQEMGANLPSLYGGSVAWGDYDNDNDLDLLLSGTDYYGEGATLLYRNDNGSFHSVPVPFCGVSLGEAAWLDYNNDGFLDVIVTGDTLYNAPVTRLYKNNGDGSFSYIPSPFFPSINSFVAIGDYNNDGNQDILVAGYSDSFFLTRLYRNDNGTFVDSGIAFDSVAYGDGIFTDYDKDGDPDLFFIGANNQVQYIIRQYRNDGNGIFIQVPNNMKGEWGGEISAADFNNDGYPDLGVTGSLCCGDALTRLYKNNGDGTFDTLPMNFPPMANSQICFGDFDNDGDADFILTGYPAGDTIPARTYLYRNMSRNAPLTPNTPPNAPDGLTSEVDGQKVIFHWDHAQDDLTPSLALTYNIRVGLSPATMERLAPYSNPADGFVKVYDVGNVGQDTSWTLLGLPTGEYYWSVQALDHSSAASVFAPAETFSVGNAGTQEIASGEGLVRITPNPVGSTMKITAGKSCENAHFFLCNLNGKRILSGKLDGTSAILDTQNLAPGIYFLVLTKDNNILKIKVVKE